MSPIVDRTQDDVERLVRQELTPRQPAGYQLEVGRIERFEEDWWRVCVRPSRDGVRADEYAQILTNVEECLRDQHALNVVLVPVLV